LGGLPRQDWLRSLAGGKISKIFIGPGKNLIGVDAPDDGDDGVAGPIIATKVGFHVRPAESLDIGHIAYDRLSVWMRRERRGHVGFEKQPAGICLHP
jgi:hypothetical protein